MKRPATPGWSNVAADGRWVRRTARKPAPTGWDLTLVRKTDADWHPSGPAADGEQALRFRRRSNPGVFGNWCGAGRSHVADSAVDKANRTVRVVKESWNLAPLWRTSGALRRSPGLSVVQEIFMDRVRSCAASRAAIPGSNSGKTPDVGRPRVLYFGVKRSREDRRPRTLGVRKMLGLHRFIPETPASSPFSAMIVQRRSISPSLWPVATAEIFVQSTAAARFPGGRSGGPRCDRHHSFRLPAVNDRPFHVV